MQAVKQLKKLESYDKQLKLVELLFEKIFVVSDTAIFFVNLTYI